MGMSEKELSYSSRHKKITGDFGEHLVLYWLSKRGFESILVDHTGIDLISRNPITDELMGISVKTRSSRSSTLNIPNTDFEKVEEACRNFKCNPYFAIVVDDKSEMLMFIMNMETFKKYAPPTNKRDASWKLSNVKLEEYKKDKDIFMVKMQHEPINWW